MGSESQSRDPWLIHILLNKLDEKTKTQWATHTADNQFPNIQELFDFLLRRCDALDSVRNTTKRNPASKSAQIKSHVTTSNPSCPVCESHNHSIYQCSSFQGMDSLKRRDWIKEKRRCFNCLGDRHPASKCASRRRCMTCKGKHHTLLHLAQLDSEEVSKEERSSRAVISTNTMLTAQGQMRTAPSILPTAMAKVMNSSGTFSRCRVLLDSGSQASFITESCIQQLGIQRKNARLTVHGLGQVSSGTTRGVATIHIHPIVGPSFAVNVFILKKITSSIPKHSDARKLIEAWSTITLADPSLDKSAEVDILIGADHFFHLLIDGQIRMNKNLPILQNTVFGWVVAGNCGERNTDDEPVVNSFTINVSDFDIDKTLRRFWELEEIESKAMLTEEEELCESTFQTNVLTAEDGHVIVKLPFKRNQDILGESLPLAIRRLQGMERRFQKDQWLYNEYKTFMEEYEKLGHMQEIPVSERLSFGVYLPHHGVVKQSSSTTKLRVVFDASAKTSSGVALNDCIAVGPTVQSSLTEILLRFRERAVVVAADVEKMYRQVWVTKNDANFQRIVWRNQLSQQIKHYRLLTVTYGTASAPFLATRVLKEIGLQQLNVNPMVANAILHDFYVDDLLSGANSIQEARKLKEGVDAALRAKGFMLRKWASNAEELVDKVPERETLQFNDDSNVLKILGIHWNQTQDKFHFHVDINESSAHITKRKVLSYAGRLFDPLGWLAPVTIQIKVFIQQLWLADLHWDDPLHKELVDRWNEIYRSLPQAKIISIPRFLGNINPTQIELHGFSDASERAYAAVVYMRTTSSCGKVIVNLIISKTKVAPIKQISIPRLELCGAVLLTKLIKFVERTSTLNVHQIIAWTDSQIVLDWLSSHPRRWKTFVGNRTSQILDALPRQNWRHVSSSDNPADCASRGITPERLNECQLWWKGPSWLSDESGYWPSSEIQNHHYDTQAGEIHKACAFAAFVDKSQLQWFNQLLTRYPTLTKLKTIMAYILRFINIIKTRKPPKSANLTREELFESLHKICEYDQTKFYGKEIQQLRQQQEINKNSSIKSLSPFLDESGLLRVGGRLENANIPYSTKHPIILHPKSQLSKLIISTIHMDNKHSGPSLTLAITRQEFWIHRGRMLVRQVINHCVTCTKFKARVKTQLMGNLPNPRVELVRPFLKVGVDYFGPMLVHMRKGRGQKSYKHYVCLFICLSTKAIHLELVGDLSSEAFLGALKRFVSRRGVCQEIYSDNGTNFLGADRKLRDEFSKIIKTSEFISDYSSRQCISWHYSPPAAPHFGGIWEAGVKSAKYHLRRVIGKTILTLEEMSTLLTEIESILNSRPLCSIKDADIDVLTPSHFLIGHPYTKIPELNITNLNPSHLTRWHIMKQLTQHFWRRWSLEYLTTLQHRMKWRDKQDPVQLNDMVVIKDNNLPVGNWRLGRVIMLHPGSDGLTRVATVKTSTGELVRPVNKLCILPTSSELDDNIQHSSDGDGPAVPVGINTNL